ncbi:hypothetical protein ACU5V1_003844, partial [Acinetobacter baumannii]
DKFITTDYLQQCRHEYTIRTLVEQHNIAEAYTLKT